MTERFALPAMSMGMSAGSDTPCTTMDTCGRRDARHVADDAVVSEPRRSVCAAQRAAVPTPAAGRTLDSSVFRTICGAENASAEASPPVAAFTALGEALSPAAEGATVSRRADLDLPC